MLILKPAVYSKPYPQNMGEVEAAWNNGQDFKIVGGPYCSIRDIEAIKATDEDVFLYSCSDQQTKRV